jgi:Lrp/AsnC family transcriptional regulator for asnA, asnC and gidA
MRRTPKIDPTDGVPPTPAELDDLDLALVERLQRDGRRSLTDLAQELSVSHGTVRNRLERLFANGAIRISAHVDPTRVGFPTLVFIGINADLSHLESLESKLAELPEVIFVATVTGRYDFLIGGAFLTDNHLRSFLVRKLSKLSGIKSTETLHMLNLGKRTWQWEIPVRADRRRTKSA